MCAHACATHHSFLQQDEVQFLIVAISEDVSPLSQDHIKMMRRAQFELTPEVNLPHFLLYML